jgi:hypothetical protein
MMMILFCNETPQNIGRRYCLHGAATAQLVLFIWRRAAMVEKRPRKKKNESITSSPYSDSG